MVKDLKGEDLMRKRKKGRSYPLPAIAGLLPVLLSALDCMAVPEMGRAGCGKERVRGGVKGVKEVVPRSKKHRVVGEWEEKKWRFCFK